jgi:PhnB protein
MDDKQLIRKLYKDLTIAIRNKDVTASTAPFANSSVMFVLAPPLRFKTGENSPGANDVEEWFSTFESNIGMEHQELEITRGNDVAFCHSLVHPFGKRTDGIHTNVWYRETLGLRKIDDQWKITHHHQSVPMYMDGSEKAATDLIP